MHQAQQKSVGNGSVTNIVEYRQRKHPAAEDPPKWTSELTEKMIDEVSLYLLKAVRVLRSIPQE